MKSPSPSGMPMMVRHRRTPVTRCAKAIQIPTKTNHMTLPSRVQTVGAFGPGTTIRSNGHRANAESLKHRSPKGKPMIVMQRTKK